MTEVELFRKLKDEFQKIIEENHLEADGVKTVPQRFLRRKRSGSRKQPGLPDSRWKRGDAAGGIQRLYRTGIHFLTRVLFRYAAGTRIPILKTTLMPGRFSSHLNAVMRHPGLADRTIHCKNRGPELCAQQFVPYLKETYGSPKILQVGYQPAIFQNVAENFEMRILDLNPENVGTEKYGVTVEHGIDAYEDAVAWADLILCTGSTICNGSVVKYLDIGKGSYLLRYDPRRCGGDSRTEAGLF